MESEGLSIIKPILSSVFTIIIGAIGLIINRVIRSKKEKKIDKITLKKEEIDMDKTFEERIDELQLKMLNLQEDLSKVRIDLLKERELRDKIERERDKYEYLLDRLVKSITKDCPSFDTSHYKKHLYENEKQ